MLNGSVSSVLDEKVIVMYRLGAWLFKFSNKSYLVLISSCGQPNPRLAMQEQLPKVSIFQAIINSQ